MSGKKHAILSASGSERWLNCPGSVKLSEKAPSRKESRYAEEGTLAHSCLEAMINLESLSNEYTPEMIIHAGQAVDEIKSRMIDTSELLTEKKVDLSFIDEGMFGTCDFAIVDKGICLLVGDYKYGAHVAVDPENNSQLIYYALGLAHKYDYDFKFITLMIIQPRSRHPEGTVREWNMSIRELRRWKGIIARGVLRTKKANAALLAGEWCMFCPAKNICPARMKNSDLVKFDGGE